MRRFAVLFGAAVASVFLVLGLGGSAAWAAEDQGFQGTLINSAANNEPVSGVTVTVSTDSGEEVGSAESDDEGKWKVVVDEPGTYVIEIDESTIPDDLVVTNGRPKHTIEVDAGQMRPALFPLGDKPQDKPSDDGSDSKSQGEEKDDNCVSDPETGEDICSNSVVNRWVSVIYNGVHFGLIIALAAMGLSLIYGTMGLTNFSHGELVTIGAALAYMINVGFGLPLILSGALAIALSAGFGWVQDKYFWGRLRQRNVSLVTMMIISIGVALSMRYGVSYFMGSNTERFSEYVRQTPWDLGFMQVVPRKIFVDIASLVLIIAVALALKYTRFGKAVRAVADNQSLAAASGIDVDRVIRWVWTVGGALAAMAGIALAIDQGVKYEMGLKLLLLIFAAVILGGIGTAFGALIGSLIIGVFMQITTIFVESEMKYVGALLVLIIVLIFRPQGLLGRRERVG